MNYFDASNIPKNFLRAEFLTQSALQTEQLGRLFATVTERLLKLQTGKTKARVGLKGQKNNGKTTFSLGLVNEVSDGSFPIFGLNGWSNKYSLKIGGDLLHYDPAAIDANLSVHGPDYMPMRMMRELSQHEQDQSSARMHLIEWPERDPKNTNVHVLWHFLRMGNSQCRIQFFSREEIFQLPETTRFIEDTAEFHADMP